MRIYRFADLSHAGQHAAEVRYPVLDVNFRSKLSSACYNTYIQPRLAVSDFDGALQVWDTQHNADVVAFDEHTDRVWSVDCSVLDPSMILSASMDGTAKLWDSNVERSVATISPGSQVRAAQWPAASRVMRGRSCVSWRSLRAATACYSQVACRRVVACQCCASRPCAAAKFVAAGPRVLSVRSAASDQARVARRCAAQSSAQITATCSRSARRRARRSSTTSGARAHPWPRCARPAP